MSFNRNTRSVIVVIALLLGVLAVSAQHHLEKQTGIRFSYTQFRALLSKHEYVYRQPKHHLSDLQDAEAKAAAEELLDWLKKSPSPKSPSSSSLWTKRA